MSLASTSAFAFPSNTRYGYANCSSCHVSPTGGGVLTAYGRNSSEEFLSTSSYKNEAELLHGALHDSLPSDSPVKIGGDVRYLSFRAEPKGGKLESENFWMQREAEVAVTVQQLTVAASGGYYALGDNKYEAQTHRNYVLLNINEHVSLRAGKFYPAYGILIEDHTTATRSGLGWDEGQETYNFEVAYKAQYGELFITPMLGSDNTTEMTPTQGYIFRTDEKGVAARATAYVGSSSQVGLSALYTQVIDPVNPGYRTYYGAFGILGITRSLYAMTEVDVVHLSSASQAKFFSYDLLGYEILKGLHLQALYQKRDTLDEYAGKVQWFPRPHWELTASYNVNKYETMGLFLIHYYL